MKTLRLRPPARPGYGPLNGAFSLVEVVLALAITAIALVSIIGLMAVGLQSSRESEDETMAALLSKELIRRLQTKAYEAAVPGNGASEDYPLPALDVPGSVEFFVDDDNLVVSEQNSIKRVRIDVRPVPPLQAVSLVPDAGDISQNVLSQVIITVSWPAQAPDNIRQQVAFHTELTALQ